MTALTDKYGKPACIGLTGQMHGILYADENGKALGPLYTWQDGRGGLVHPDGEMNTYAERLAGLTSGRVAPGYGLATHYYNLSNGLVPPRAAKLCTIGDYVAMGLTGRREPFIHSTNAASLGCFCGGGFDRTALGSAGIDTSILPDCTDKTELAGLTPDGIPVSVAIGDNQASFLGSVADWEDSLLANIGTGSQISFVDNDTYDGLEARPFFGNETLTVGAGLCGGRSYAMLEAFFRRVLAMAGRPTDQSLYRAMGEYLAKNPVLSDPLHVTTKFNGTREDPRERGSIAGISTANFTPEALISGFIHGMAGELRALLPASLGGRKTLVASGNGVCQNPALARAISEAFHMPVRIPLHTEEAAYGAALFALAAAGRFHRLSDAKSFIRYCP